MRSGIVKFHLGRVLGVALCSGLVASAPVAAAEVAGMERPTAPPGAAAPDDRASQAPKPSTGRERQASRVAHDDLSRGEALNLARTRFADELTAPVLAPTEDQLGGVLVSRPDAYSAVVRGPLGRRSMLRSSSALTVGDEAGREQPVDLRLKPGEDGAWLPTRSGTGLIIDGDLEAGVELDGGIGMRLLDSTPHTPVEQQDRVFFNNVATDTDLALKPLPEGVEHLLQVRSPDAPETFSFEVEMPSDAYIRPVHTDEPIMGDPPRVLEIVRGSEALGYIKPPLAYDADGRPVSSSLTYAGNVVTYHVIHRAADVMYPLMVDPSFLVAGYLASWPGWATRTNGASFGFAAGNPAYNPYGLYLSMPTNTLFNGGDWGQWYFRAPAGTSVQGTAFINMAHQTYYSVQSVGLADNRVWQQHAWRDNTTGAWGWSPFTSGYSYSGKTVDACFEWTVCGSPGPTDGNEAILGLESTIYFNTLSARPFTSMNSAYVWLGDRHKPTIHNADPPPGWLSSTSFPVYTVATDHGLGVEWMKWYVDDTYTTGTRGYCPGTTPVPCAWHLEHSPTLSTSEGLHKIKVEAIDALGNLSTTVRDVKVDITPPEVTLSGTLASASNHQLTGPATLGINATDGSNSSAAARRSGVAEISIFRERLTAGGWTAIDVPSTGPVTSTGSSVCPADSCSKSLSYTANPAAFTYGRYRLRVEARDQHNRLTTRYVEFEVPDTEDPQVTLSGPATQPLSSGGRLDIKADDPDATSSGKASGVESVTVRVDGVIVRTEARTDCLETCPSTWQFQHVLDPDALGDGAHTVEVTAKDKSGRTGSKSTVVYVLDLDLNERDQLGLEDYFQYQSTETGAGSRLHVNAATGNAVWHSTPVVNPGRGLSTVVNLTYNSQDRGGLLASLLSASGGAVLLGEPLQNLLGVAYGEVGRGFSIGISGVTRLNEPLAGVATAGTIGRIRLTDPDGTSHLFTDDNLDGIFDEPPGVHLRLRRFSTNEAAKRWAITRPDGVTFFFDATGYATTVEDRNGNVLRFTYETYSKVDGSSCPVNPLPALVCAKRVVKVTDAVGVDTPAKEAARSLRIEYAPGGYLTLPSSPAAIPSELALFGGSAGRIAAIVDHADRATEFEYDGQGYLTSMTQGVQRAANQPADRTHTRTFTLGYSGASGVLSQKLLSSIEDPNGNETTVEYDPQVLLEPGRRVAKVTDRRESEWTYDYPTRTDADGSVLEVTDPLDRILEYRQDVLGRPEIMVDAREVETHLDWDDNASYGRDNNVSRLTQAAGTDDEAVTDMEYNRHGQLTKQTDAEGRETTLSYRTGRGTHIASIGVDDAGGWVSDLEVLTPPEDNETKFTLDARGNVEARQVDELTAATTEYDADGQVESETDEAGNEVEYEGYDDSGLPTARVDEEGHRWEYAYDAVGNLLSQTDPRGVATTNDDEDYVTSLVYDPLDRVLESKVPRASASGSFVTRSTTYDDNGNVLTQTDGTGATRTKAYTAMDEPRREASPPVDHFGESQAAAEVSTQEHDAVGRVVRTIAPNGEGGNAGDWETEQQYDDADRLIVTRRKALNVPAGGQSQLVTSTAYDDRGNVVAVTDPRGNVTGNPIANASDPAKQRFAYTYDLTNNRTVAVEDPDGLQLRTEFAYDDNENLEAEIAPRGFSENDEPGFTTQYERDANELVTAITQGDRTTAYERRDDGRVLSITKPEGVASSTAGDYRTSYAYSKTGEVKSWTLPRAPGQYGPAGRGVTYTRNEVGDPVTITDPRGNSFTNTFFDTGQLKSTQRPSWWKAPEVDGTSATASDDPSLDPLADERAASMPVQERRYEEWLHDEGDGALPSSEGQGDFGAVDRAPEAPVIPRAGATTFDYDAEMRLTSVTDAGNDPVTFVRDAVGRITAKTRPIGGIGNQVTAYSFDRNGNLRKVTDPTGAESTLGYDEFGRQVTETAPGSSAAAPGVGLDGTVAAATTTSRYDANGNVAAIVTPRGKTYTRGYDAVDRLLSEQDPAGGARSFAYDANGNTVRERSPRGNAPGEPNPARFDTLSAYSTFDELVTQTDGSGQLTQYGYNRNGEQTLVDAPGAGLTPDATTAPRRVTQREFDGRGLPWKEIVGSSTQSTLATTVTGYDPNGNLRRTIAPKGVGGSEPAGADSADQEGDPSGTAGRHATVAVHDASDLRTAQWMPWGERDAEDRVQYRRTFERDALGRVTSIESPFATAAGSAPAKPKTARTTYGYTETGWILEATDWHYDATGSTPTVDQNHTYAYNARGDQTEWRHVQSGRHMTRAYYPSGKLRERSARKNDNDPTPRNYTYGYNEAGTLVEMRDHQLARTTQVRADDLERPRIVDETWSGGKDTKQVWDLNGNLVERRTDGEFLPAQPAGPNDYRYGKTSKFQFDILDRETKSDVVQAGRAGIRSTLAEYWPSGDLKKRTKTNGTVEDWGYRDDGQVKAMRRHEPGAAAGVFDKDTDYEYDANGNRTRDERGLHAFNARDQLVHWVGDDADVQYELNGSGAITKEIAGTETTVHEMVGDRLVRERVNGALNKTYHYDDLGNVEQIEAHQQASDTATFVFDEFGRMTSGTSYDPIDEVFETERWAYDGLDRRDFKCIGSTAVDCAGGQKRDHTYVGMSELLSLHRLDGDDEENRKTASYDYTSSGERLGQDRMVTADPADGIFRPYATDANGTVEGLEDQNGKTDGTGPNDGDGESEYKTNPYGEELNSSTLSEAAQSNPFRFQGFYYDAGLKTYDMQARVYRPEVGRFMSGDRFESAAGDFNLQTDHLTQNRYAFAGGNPVNRIEWDGHISFPEILKEVACRTPTYMPACTFKDLADKAQKDPAGALLELAMIMDPTKFAKSLKLGGRTLRALEEAITAEKVARARHVLARWEPYTFPIDNPTNFSSSSRAVIYHFKKHVIDEGVRNTSVLQYTDDAEKFMRAFGSKSKLVADEKNPGRMLIQIDVRGVGGGKFTLDGKIVTFHYKTSDAAKARRAIRAELRRLKQK